MDKELYLGIMSGTSLDGVDTVVMDFSQNHFQMVACGFTPMPETLRKSLAALCLRGEGTLRELGELDNQLGHLYAKSVQDLLLSSGIKAADISAIGCHGQTIWHAPQGDVPFTMQIGDANVIAAQTGITTIADFRRKDMAYGGQGAPLVPAFHQALFSDPQQLTVVLNIGGMSNISILQAGEPARGYDTGPGNVLMDAWIERHLGLSYDNGGQWAQQGEVNNALLQQLLSESFFAQPAPKSTGRELFSLVWLLDKLASFPDVSPVDVQATLVEFTGVSIRDELLKLPHTKQSRSLLVCGGGAKNPLLMARLADMLPDWTVGTTTESGLDIDYVEAAAFAWLACQRMHNLPGNVPEVTGATRAVPLGVIYPAD
ncbi:anhydro-N-acetylmuramic acid kinase [Citrobacter sp. JGM124]|uniref:anhydro-N-acetylmuramic acid kinase n=1 Tax=Citrobacter sp. JGM124 TaxID=2799789 RepID=UPI0032C46DF0